MGRQPHVRWASRALCALVLFVAVLVPGAAWAQGTDNYPPSTTVTTNPCTGSQVEVGICGTAGTVARAPGDPGGELPFTGGDVALLTVLGLAAAAGGGALVWFGRRSSHRTA